MCHHFDIRWAIEDMEEAGEETPSFLNEETDQEVELLADGGDADDA